MSLQPLPAEQVQKTVQVLLTYLDDPRNTTPNDMLEGIVSSKSLLRGILAGQVVVCQNVAGEPDKAAPVKKPEAAKKVAKKAAKT